MTDNPEKPIEQARQILEYKSDMNDVDYSYERDFDELLH